MRAFGGFKSGDRFFYGEMRGNEVHLLARPYWIDIEPAGEVRKLAEVDVDLPVAPSKLIAVGLNYSDHIAEMNRTPLAARKLRAGSPKFTPFLATTVARLKSWTDC